MLHSIHLQNFRSVRSANFVLPDTGLGVLIGANGSGKSNVVRAFEFISSIHEVDLFDAVASQGGSFSIVPKAIPTSKIRETTTELEYTIRLPRSSAYPENVPPATGTHQISIDWTAPNDFRVSAERLEFSNPLATGLELLRAQQDSGESLSDHTDAELEELASKGSRITFVRTDEHNISVNANPSFNSDNLSLYLKWLGLDFLMQLGLELETGRDLREFLGRVGRQVVEQEGQLLESQDSMLSLGSQAPFFFSQPVSYFTSVAGDIKRFDLQIAQLRKEQQMRHAGQMTSEGDNLPSVVRWLRRGGAKLDEWKRIKSTLRDIAPYVTDIRNKSLRTGKEYVQFDETEEGREVESWDSSDGTLRALAMLVAVETHPAPGTIIIEEPEQALHPWAIESLLSHIRTVIEDKALQVLITTHSEQVLRHVAPTEVLVASRTEERGTVLSPVSDLVEVESPSSDQLGRLWVKGLLGGVPDYQ